MAHTKLRMASHRADPLFVEQLLNMGFPEVRAEKAVVKTHNCGVEPALNWLLEHISDPDIDEPWVPNGGEASTSGSGGHMQWGLVAGGEGGLVLGVPSDTPVVVQPDGGTAPATLVRCSAECKVVLVVAARLGMSTGKTGAQCAHAAVGLYKALLAARVPWLEAWEEQGEKTVVLQADSCEQLHELCAQAADLGLQTHMVYDAGRTEVAAGANTVLAIGGVSDTVDGVTGRLKTLR